MTEVTQILSQFEQGDPTVAGQLLPLVNDELRKLTAANWPSGGVFADFLCTTCRHAQVSFI
jgi:hypothetical protein